MRRWAPALLALPMLLHAAPARADIDNSAYEAVGAVRGERERQRLQQEFARQEQQEKEAEREAARREEEARARREAEEAARLAALPYPQRLTETRCTACHAATNFSAQAHTLPGWWVVVRRMKHLNHAPVSEEEIAVIVEYLAGRYPARGEDAALEYVAAAALPALALTVAWGLRRRRVRQTRGEGR